MRTGHPSRTAEYMALFRALESARPPDRRVVHDPFAHRFLPLRLRLVARAARLRPLGAAVERVIDARWPGARTSGVARTRLIDDLLADALDHGTTQIVILGAGFDARAYRLPAARRARVFEVDHPDTLRAKRQRLERAPGVLPAHVTFVAVDFARHALGRALDAAGFDRRRPAFFIWEGVTNYLSADAVDATLAVVRTAAPGSELAFTYVERAALGGAVAFAGAARIAGTLARAGEPWTFGIEASELRPFLAERGFELVRDVGSVDYRARYLGAAGPHLRGYEFYRLAVARVPTTRSAAGTGRATSATAPS